MIRRLVSIDEANDRVMVSAPHGVLEERVLIVEPSGNVRAIEREELHALQAAGLVAE